MLSPVSLSSVNPPEAARRRGLPLLAWRGEKKAPPLTAALQGPGRGRSCWQEAVATGVEVKGMRPKERQGQLWALSWGAEGRQGDCQGQGPTGKAVCPPGWLTPDPAEATQCGVGEA